MGDGRPRLLTGTSGFSYEEWKGSFYPEGLPASAMLAHYAERLPAVEINNTFYRLPSTSLLEGWAGQVPEGFVFALKASRRITHQGKLVGVEEPLAYLAETSSVLGSRRGPILFQLPPFLKKGLERLKSFLDLLPDDLEAAFEFRHPSWLDDEVFAALGERGAALCVADAGDPELTARVATARFGYLRLRREEYGDDRLVDWAAWVREQGWERAYAFFKHEDEGAGPRLARRFAELYADG